jgi:hypothetical protein
MTETSRMWNKPLSWDWVAVGTFILALVSVVTLAITFWQMNKTLNNKTISEWQQVVVLSIIEEEKLDGITFKEIEEKYVTKATYYKETAIPKNKIQPEQLKLVMMDLKTKNLIEERFDGKFFKQVTPFHLDDITKQLKSDEQYNSIGDAIIDIIISSPDEHDANSLYLLVESKLKTETTSIERRLFDRVLNEMIANQTVLKRNNKFSSNISN